MEFRVLGPLEVRVDDRPLPLGGTRPRVVLAALLLGRNTVVPVDRLIAAIWGENPPGTPTAQIQAAVSALRKTVGADRIVTRTPGYLIRVDRGELDLDEFDREVAAARRALHEGDARRAADGLHAALLWWRDDVLVDLADMPVRAVTVPVDEQRWTVWEERIEVDLALRRHAELVPELSTLVTKKPLRDRLWTQLMRAQYRCGRRADALETYQRARQVMRDELGLEPAAELVAVHRAVLADDPALDPDVLPPGQQPGWTRPPCPYRALAAYQPDDATSFFGRDAETAAVVERMRAGPVTVVGPSGSGKSSLVLAGVLPALARATALVVRPADHGRVDLALAAAIARVLPAGDDDLPALAARIVDGGLDDLAGRILTHRGSEQLVVVLDQAEELLAQDAPLVDRVVTALFTADRLTVLATLRADFLGEVLARPALSTTLGGRGVFTLGAMSRDQLREAVTAPVRRLPGVSFQAGLVDRILDDVGAEPGALALLGLTLALLWDDQVDGTLTHQAYDDLGRVPGALATHAEGEWRRHNLADEEPVVRRLVGRLVQVRPGGRATRRVASRAELDDRAWHLAERLSSTRLLVVTGDAGSAHVELAHEALTTHWPRLCGWIEGDVDFHLWRTALRADLERWERAGCDPALLARGSALADARRWRADRGGELGPDETDFVRRSDDQQRSTGRRSRMLRAVLATAAVLVLVLGVVLVVARQGTAAATADAESRELAAGSVATAGRDPARAALMALAAYDRAPTAEAGAALFDRYTELGGLDALYPGDLEQGFVRGSADARVVAGVRGGTDVMVWVRDDPGRPARLLRTTSADRDVDVAADGSGVWVLAPDGIARVDVATGETRTVVPTGWSGDPQLALSVDGTRVLLRDDLPDAAAPTYRVREWSTVDGRASGSATFAAPTTRGVTVRADPRPGRVLVSTYSPERYLVEELDLATGARAAVAEGPSGAVATDGSGVVTCTADGDTLVLTGVRTADRAPLGRAELPDTAERCPNLAVGPGGRVFVDVGLPDVRTVDLATGSAVRLAATAETLWAGTFLAGVTPDGSRLLLSGPSWIGVADASATVPVLQNAQVLDDGRGLVGVSEDGRSLVVSPLIAGGPQATAPRPSTYLAPPATALEVGHSGVVADRVADDRVVLRRLPGLEPLGTVTLAGGRLDALFFDTADRLVTVADRRVSWWDPRTGSPVHQVDVGRAGPGLQVAPMPDPDRIAVSLDGSPDLTLHDIGDGRVVDTLALGSVFDHVRFQRSSDYVLVSRPTSTEIWDSRTRQRVLGPLPADEGAARVAGMTGRAGHFLVMDQLAGSWQLRTYEVGSPNPLVSVDLGTGVVPADLSADGDVIALDVAPDGPLWAVHRLDPAVWRDELCAALAGADLTTADRAMHPGVADGPVCGPR